MQYTAPHYIELDLRHTICPSCDQPPPQSLLDVVAALPGTLAVAGKQRLRAVLEAVRSRRAALLHWVAAARVRLGRRLDRALLLLAACFSQLQPQLRAHGESRIDLQPQGPEQQEPEQQEHGQESSSSNISYADGDEGGGDGGDDGGGGGGPVFYQFLIPSAVSGWFSEIYLYWQHRSMQLLMATA